MKLTFASFKIGKGKTTILVTKIEIARRITVVQFLTLIFNTAFKPLFYGLRSKQFFRLR